MFFGASTPGPLSNGEGPGVKVYYITSTHLPGTLA